MRYSSSRPSHSSSCAWSRAIRFRAPKITPEVKERLRAHYGLDKPLIEQYLIYMGNLLQGDFGYSLSSRGRRVNTIIAEGFPASLDLGIRAMVIAIVFGLFFGIVAALNRGKPLDYLTVVLVLVGISVPSFVVAGVLQYWLGVHLKVLPVARYESVSHTIMPSFALSLGTMAVIARYMRASMLEIVNADYIRTARAKGLRRRQIVWRHQIRNAIFPVLTILGPAVASVLTGLLRHREDLRDTGPRPPLRSRDAEPRLHAGHGPDGLLRRLPHRHELSRRRRLRADRPAHPPFLPMR